MAGRPRSPDPSHKLSIYPARSVVERATTLVGDRSKVAGYASEALREKVDRDERKARRNTNV